MKRLGISLFMLLALLVVAPSAFAQATRTWVSGVGDDANPCSRTAPCKTFAGAISKTAAAGEINVLDPGGFGAVTITKAITIDGGSSLSGVLVSGTNGIVVSAGASDVVVLRNLDINGIGTGLNGIKFTQGKTLIVDNCKIFEFTQNGIDVELNQATHAHVTVRNSQITNNLNSGVFMQNLGASTQVLNGIVTGTQIRGGTGGALPSNGIVAGPGAIIDVSGADIGSFNGSGLQITGTSGLVSVIDATDSTITDGTTGINPSGFGVIRISNVNVFNQTTGVGVGSGSVASAGNNHKAGNGTGVLDSVITVF